jgi:hypothetical protein
MARRKPTVENADPLENRIESWKRFVYGKAYPKPPFPEWLSPEWLAGPYPKSFEEWVALTVTLASALPEASTALIAFKETWLRMERGDNVTWTEWNQARCQAEGLLNALSERPGSTPEPPENLWMPAADAARAHNLTLPEISKAAKRDAIRSRKPTAEQRRGREHLQVHALDVMKFAADKCKERERRAGL